MVLITDIAISSVEQRLNPHSLVGLNKKVVQHTTARMARDGVYSTISPKKKGHQSISKGTINEGDAQMGKDGKRSLEKVKIFKK